MGSSSYWWGPTAQFKAFVDRWYGARRATFVLASGVHSLGAVRGHSDALAAARRAGQTALERRM